MHRCVCIWRYILQNYNYKLHFQNLSIYDIPHVSVGTLWLLKILMFALLMTHETARYNWPWEKTGNSKYMLGLLLILISKSWGCPPGAGHPFPRQWHMRRGEGDAIYLFLPGFSSLYDAIHGWMMGWMDGWKASRKTTTRSFTICNNNNIIVLKNLINRFYLVE
jgi:hypothetical protein